MAGPECSTLARRAIDIINLWTRADGLAKKRIDLKITGLVAVLAKISGWLMSIVLGKGSVTFVK